MQHADTRTFLKYYLSRRIDKNLPAVIRGLNPEDNIIRAACWMSRTIDLNRPQELTTAQSSSVNQQPEILDLVRQRDDLSRRLGRPLTRHRGMVKYDVYQKFKQELAGARQRARDALLSQLQQKYDREQPMLEIQRLLSGVKLAETVTRTMEHSEEVPAPQKRLIESLLTLPRATWKKIWVDALKLLKPLLPIVCSKKGIRAVTNVPLAKLLLQDQNITKEHYWIIKRPKTVSRRTSDWKSPFDLDKRPHICFICLGQPKLDFKRVQQFAAHGDVTKHIKRKHLQYSATRLDLRCNLCNKQFLNTMLDNWVGLLNIGPHIATGPTTGNQEERRECLRFDRFQN
jgi:Protein of unknown function (DUF3435)